MNNDELWRLSSAEMGRLFRERSLTPTAVAKACLARLDAVNPLINAVIARRDAAFLAEAAAATVRHARGQPLSAIDGIPISVKDSLLTSDLPTTWGTRGLQYHQSEHDEAAVARVRAAGSPCIGKTNVPEFAMEGYTDNPLFGATRNPWDRRLTPGGSSGGAVSSVACGITPLAVGQDGGGSIRRPASHAGLVGLKPSLGAVPREHVFPSLMLDFEVIGPLTRTVADARLLFNVMRGPSPTDRLSMAAAFASAQTQRAAPLHILYVERFGAAPLDPQIAHSVGQAADRLGELGHHIEKGPLPLDLDFFVEASPQVGQIGLARMFDTHPNWESQASQKYRDMADQGRRLPAARLWQIVEQVARLRREAARLFANFDAIVLPSAAALPWPVDQAYPQQIDGQEVGPRGHAIYTGWVNAAGLPGLALPCTPSSEGLPIGMQVIGPYGADDMLLDLGAQYEAAHPWAHRWPEIG